MKLGKYLKNPDGSLKVDVVGADNKCELGQWIYGDGSKYSTFEEFGTLKTEHSKFPKACSEVVKKADSGKDTSEETALGGSSAFSQASSAVITAIMKMKMNAK